MSEVEAKVIEALRAEPSGAAALLIAKKAGVTLMEAVRTLEDLASRGVVEKRGKTYRLVKA
ncbi:MAG: hypothetical protein DRJ97_07230 [Thermoprotei archaeon]|nr:MAG: hypothetical protein DRJ97_07230 [Thermoprotei archaeon]